MVSSGKEVSTLRSTPQNILLYSELVLPSSQILQILSTTDDTTLPSTLTIGRDVVA